MDPKHRHGCIGRGSEYNCAYKRSPESAMAAKSERLALRVSDTFLDGLDQLSNEEQVSRSDIIRRAVALYAFAREEARSGRKLGFFTEEGDRQIVKQVVAL